MIEDQIEPSLRSFMSRTDLSPDKNETPMRVILQAYYEDLVKTAYLEFLKILEIILHDQVQAGREFAMRTVKDLLVAGRNASSENVLLRLLVNKLGDHSRKVASRVSFYLQNVVDTHERLTLPTVQLVQDEITKASAVALYRPPSAKDIKKRPKLSKSKLNSKPSGNDKPAYYGLCFFSQLRLSSDTPDVTRVLLKTYQYLLEVFISRLEEPLGKGKHSKNKRSAKDLDENDAEEAPRIIKVVLTGLSRAIPFYPSVAGNSMMTSNKAENLSLTAYVSRIMDIAKKIRSYPILLQASNLILRIFSAPGQKNEESFSVLSRMASENLLDCTRMADALASHPLLFKLLYRLFTFLGESSSPAATKAMQTLCKSLLASACAIQSPAFPAAALLLVNEAFSLKPELRLSVSFPADQAVEYDEIITSNSNIIDHKKTTETTLWELCLLASHCNPTVRRYARTLLSNDPQNNQIDIRNEPEDPFLSLSNGPFLETLIRGNGGSGGGNKKEVYNGQGSDVQDR